MNSNHKKRLVIGISGASGIPIAEKLLKELSKRQEWETHLVISRGGEKTANLEGTTSPQELRALADTSYEIDDFGAAIASGTFRTQGMVIVPCSMKTVAGIASGFSDNLLLRAADVTLKERRPLILVTRETPMSYIHLKNMAALAQIGAVILPPMLTFYNKPNSIDDMVTHIVGKILDQLDIEINNMHRWGELTSTGSERL